MGNGVEVDVIGLPLADEYPTEETTKIPLGNRIFYKGAKEILSLYLDLDCQQAKVVVSPVLDGMNFPLIEIDREPNEGRRTTKIPFGRGTWAKDRRIILQSLNGENFKLYRFWWEDWDPNQNGADILAQKLTLSGKFWAVAGFLLGAFTLLGFVLSWLYFH